MSNLLSLEGNVPLIGSVELSGSKNSALKLLPAAMMSNEDIILENVPKVASIMSDLEIITFLGGKAEWVGANKLLLNGSGLNTYEIPYEMGSQYKTSLLLTAPLVFRFGRAILPKPASKSPINRWVDSWRLLGMEVEENAKFIHIKSGNVKGGNINFKVSTHMGTDNAVLSSMFAVGETDISNAAEESEVDDLIAFCNLMGADVQREEPRRIKVVGKNIFKGCNFKVQNDKDEAVDFAILALMTGGDISIKGVDKGNLISFSSFLSKLGCNFEFSKDELRVWYSNETLKPVDVVVSPAPGFISPWKSAATLLLTKSDGESLVHDTVYIGRFDYIKDLNMMGARIELFHPTEVGLMPTISDDSYNYTKKGEPQTVAKIYGPTKLRGTRLSISSLRDGVILVGAALSAEGKSEISGVEILESSYERFFEKLQKLGARLNLS